MRRILVAVAALMLMAGAQGKAHSAVVEIDFEDLMAGDIVTNQYASLGVTFSLLGDSPVPGPTVIDFPDDRYLGSGATGVAITPGDDDIDPFFDINLDFSTPIDYFSILSLDSDEPLTVSSFLGSTLVDSVTFGPGTNLEVYEVILGSIGGTDLFDSVVIDVVAGPGDSGYAGGPELFDNLVFNPVNPVPLPGTVFLLAGGLVALAACRRKYRK